MCLYKQPMFKSLFAEHDLSSCAHTSVSTEKLPWAVTLPAHTASGSLSPPGDRARRSHPGGGWRAWLSGGPWWSRMRQRRQQPGTSAPGRNHSALLCPGAHDTQGPLWDAAASTEARWSLPEGEDQEGNRHTQIHTDICVINADKWRRVMPHIPTGMGILESSLPMQFFMMLHKLRE